MKKRLLFSWWIILTISQLFGQQPYFKQITDENGLPSMTVYDIHQDRRGFMWFGTANGLVRFDGIRMKIYHGISQESREASNIKEDATGRIWYTNFSNQIFYIENDSSVLFKKYVGSRNNVIYYNFDLDGNIYISSGLDLNKYSTIFQPDSAKKTGQVVFSLQSGMIQEVGLTIKHEIVIVSLNSMYVFKNNREWIEVIFNPVGKYKSKKDIMDGKYYSVTIGEKKYTYHSLSKFSGTLIGSEIIGSKYYQDMRHVVDDITSMSFDKYQQLWLNTYNGSYVFDSTGKVINFDKPLLKGTAISIVRQDHEHNYWVGTLSEGIYFIPSLNTKIFSPKNSILTHHFITQLTKGNNNTLYGGLGNGGIFRVNTQTDEVKLLTIPHNKKSIEALGFSKKLNTIFATGTGLYSISENLDTYNIMVDRLAGKAIVETNTHVLIGARSHTNFISLKDRSFVVKDDLFGRNIHSEQIIYDTPKSFYWEEKVEHLYIGYEGLFLRVRNEKVDTLRDESGKMVYAESIAQANDGTIYLGTTNSGIMKVNQERLTSILNTSHGLSNNRINYLVADGDIIWFSTNNGLGKFIPTLNEFVLYNHTDGLISNEIMNFSLVEDRIWLGTSKGLQVIPKEIQSRNLVPPPIYITDVSVLEKNINISDEIIIEPNKNNIRISFTGISYRSQGLFTYEYRLLGLDTTWISTASTVNFARYPSLPPGSYEFQVMAFNEDHIGSLFPATLKFTVLTPFWKTVWFWFALFLISIAALIIFFQHRIKILQRESEAELKQVTLENELRQSQMTALRSQMNPHFIFNALSSIQNFVFQNDKLSANQFLGKFADLMRKVLHHSEQKEISLDEEIETIKLYLDLETLRFSQEFSYSFSISDDIQLNRFEIPPMMIQPYVENAIKHGLLHKKENCKLDISISWEIPEKVLQVKIDDNGIGRDRATEMAKTNRYKHSSFSTKATEKRLELLNHYRTNSIKVVIIDKKNDKEQSLGTLVVINIPVSSKYDENI